jgi:hypothetical protein
MENKLRTSDYCDTKHQHVNSKLYSVQFNKAGRLF